jgi:hypothetical protein
MVSVPKEELQDATSEALKSAIVDLTLLPAAPRLTPVRDMQHWLDLCG